MNFEVVQKHPALDDVPQVLFRTYPPNEVPSGPTPLANMFLDTAIGLPFLEWNSRIGVPQDVWATVSTAYVSCLTCRLACTFEANLKHRTSDGECEDPGQGLGVIAQGRG